jgi:hypothetical protein
MLLVARLLLVLILWSSAGFADARTLYILVVGEGELTSCSGAVSQAGQRVNNIGTDILKTPASVALEWSECDKGSVWNLLGQKIIGAAIAKKVLFLPAVVQHAQARDWLNETFARDKLALALKMTRTRKIRFDYAILQQGCSDVNTDSKEYLNDMRRVIRRVSLAVQPEKWLVSQSANCPGRNSGRLRAVQVQIGRNPVFNTFQGADAAKLSGTYPTAEGTLSEAGRQRLADLWLDALIRAEAASARYQRETLLYYFK